MFEMQKALIPSKIFVCKVALYFSLWHCFLHLHASFALAGIIELNLHSFFGGLTPLWNPPIPFEAASPLKNFLEHPLQD